MKDIVNYFFTILIVILMNCGGPSEQSRRSLVGVWQGAISISGTELRIVFKISEKTDNTLIAIMNSPDQGATDIPVDKVTIVKGHVRFEVRSIMGIFEGEVKEGGTRIEGEWRQSGFSLPLVLERIDKVPQVMRPQEPKKPYPYNEEEVVYMNKKAGVKLVGTLTSPRSEGPFPTVFLITGSGPQDRNETVFGHRPFLVLADYLTRHNIVVLRVDDRGIGGSTGDHIQSTSKDFADDVLAGIEFLKSRQEVNPKKIGLIGHSEGGMIAPMVVVQSPDVAFIVMMAGTGLIGEEILYLQAALIGKANGASDDEIEYNRKLQERIFDVLKKEMDVAVAKKQIREIIISALAELSDEEKQAIGYSEANVTAQINNTISPWFRFFLMYDPKPTLMRVRCPVLAINGEKDLQVPPKENLSAIQEALKAGGNSNYSIKEIPGLNHLFQTAQTGSPTEYARIEETMSPTVLEMVADWILAQ